MKDKLKFIEISYYVLFISFVIVIFIFGFTILNLTKEKKRLNNIIDKQQVRITQLEISNRLRIDLVQERVSVLHRFVKKIYPNYDYQQKFDDAVLEMDNENFNDKLESMPDNLYNAYIETYLIKDHGLQKYQLTIPDTIYPIEKEKGYVTSGSYEFGQWHPYEGRHSGCDINNKEDVQILAVHDGEIYKSFYDQYGGNTIELKFNVIIDDKKTYYFVRYRHVQNIQVRAGEKVKQGQVIASIGNTGKWSFGNHLHFENWMYNGYRWININPFMNSTYGRKYVDKL